VLRVECRRCQRKGRYSVRKLIEKYGRKGHMMKWRELLNADCPKRDAPQLHDRCDVTCPICRRCCRSSFNVERPRCSPTGAQQLSSGTFSPPGTAGAKLTG
jgi:hypothetical protein